MGILFSDAQRVSTNAYLKVTSWLNQGMPFRIKVTLAILLSLLLLLIIGPLILPIPALKDTEPAEQLADADSQFIDINNLSIHYKQKHNDAQDEHFLLLHDFASWSYTWHNVLPYFGGLGNAVAFDRPGFGLSARPLRGDWQDSNPYSLTGQSELSVALMDALGMNEGILVGHSTGATVALQLALTHPERVKALILVDPVVFDSGGLSPWVRPLLYSPQLRRVGPYFMRQLADEPGETLLRSSWYDPEAIDDATINAYRVPFQVENWDKALFELSKANQPHQLAEQLMNITVPVLVIAGENDALVTADLSEQLAQQLPDADLSLLAECGHIPQEECPDAFLSSVNDWLITQQLIPEGTTVTN